MVVILASGKGRSKKRPNVYHIEGQNISSLQAAATLGISESCFFTRMRKLKDTPGPITWAKLRGRP